MSDVNPRIDLVFKKLFGVEENKDLLIALINSVVTKADQVKDVTLLNPYNVQNFKGDKLSILDVKAQGHHGRRFNIEIQVTDFYLGQLIIEHDMLRELTLNFKNLPEEINVELARDW